MLYLVARLGCVRCKERNSTIPVLTTPIRIGFGDLLAEWIEVYVIRRTVLIMIALRFPARWIMMIEKVKNCHACKRRRRILNILFPYIPRSSLEYQAWNAYLASGIPYLPVIWDSETGLCKPPTGEHNERD